MITAAIIAILASVAYPTYQEQMRKPQRAEAKNALSRAAMNLESAFTASADGRAALTRRQTMRMRLLAPLAVSVSAHALALGVALVPPAPAPGLHPAPAGPVSFVRMLDAAALAAAAAPQPGRGTALLRDVRANEDETRAAARADATQTAAPAPSAARSDAGPHTHAATEARPSGGAPRPDVPATLLTPLLLDPDAYPTQGGTIRLRIAIDSGGVPRDVDVLAATPGFDLPAVVDTVLAARFTPAQAGGQLVDSVLLVELRSDSDDRWQAAQLAKLE